MDGDSQRNDSNHVGAENETNPDNFRALRSTDQDVPPLHLHSAAASSQSSYPAGRLEIILPFALNNVESSMPPPVGWPSSDGSQAVENVRSSRNPSIQIEDNMIGSDDDDSDWSSSDESEDEDAVDISYEVQQERRAMREQTRDANNILNEEHIATNLSRRTYQSATGTSTDHRDELQVCCICQEEYGEGEQVAGLECGHEFHFNCIKQWLVQNNSCPICKRIGLTVGRS